MTALLPCPFCQTAPEVGVVPETIDEPVRCYYLKCPDCLVETTAFDDRERAISAWNRRSPTWEGIERAPTGAQVWRDEVSVFLSTLANHPDEADEWEGRDLFRDFREKAGRLLDGRAMLAAAPVPSLNETLSTGGEA